MKISAEYTDTFAGEANYSWVRRCALELPDDTKRAAIMRAAKRELGLSGVRGRTVSHGDMVEFRPYGVCAVMFVTFN